MPRIVVFHLLFIALICQCFAQTTTNKKFSLSRQYNNLQEYEKVKGKLNSNTFRTFPSSEVDKTKLPQELNTFIQSPDKKHFVAFEDGETGTKYLYFYSSPSQLKKKVEVNMYPSVRYSQDGEHIEVFNLFGRKIMIFNKLGEEIFEGDYIDIIKNNQVVLNGVFVDKGGKEILLSTSDKVHLISSPKKEVLWESDVKEVIDCHFNSDNTISLKTISRIPTKEENFDAFLINHERGSILDKIERTSFVELKDRKITIQKAKKVYEYDIK